MTTPRSLSDLTWRQRLLGPMPRMELTLRQRVWWALDMAGSGAVFLWLAR